MKSSLSLSCVAALATAVPAFAQGSDSCATAQVIAGLGSFAFDTTAATTDGPIEKIAFNQNALINNDVWFEWVAPATGAYEISTCGQTTVPTAIAVYRYGCPIAPGRAINVRGASCAPQTQVIAGTVAGQSYLIRIGSVAATGSGTGMFTIASSPLPGILGTMVNPANGHTYHILEPSSWTVARSAALGLGGDLVTIGDQAEQTWIQQTFHTWANVNRDLWLGLNDAAVEGTFAWSSGQPVNYTNWSNGEPTNGGGGTEHYAHFRHDWGNGTWNDVFGDPYPQMFYNTVNGIVEVDSGGIGTNYCGPAVNNSTGGPGTISASGSTVVTANDVTLTASGLPPNQFGYFLNSQTQGFVFPVPNSQGALCLGGAPGRYNGNIFNSGSTGEGSLALDLPNTPTPTATVAIQAGETWNFTTWYRDSTPGPTSNFTDGIEILFQ